MSPVSYRSLAVDEPEVHQAKQSTTAQDDDHTSIALKAHRTLDPLLGAFTGVFAFYLNQTNPRTSPPPGESFKNLIHWKWAKWNASRSAKLHTDKEIDLEATFATLLKEDKIA